jgi:hypothetical protein
MRFDGGEYLFSFKSGKSHINNFRGDTRSRLIIVSHPWQIAHGGTSHALGRMASA